MDDSKERGDSEMARRIAAAIERSGQSQRAVAERMGVTPQAVTRWRRFGYIDKARIPAFCRVCGVRVEWLIAGEGGMDSPRREMSVAEQARHLAELAAELSERISGKSPDG